MTIRLCIGIFFFIAIFGIGFGGAAEVVFCSEGAAGAAAEGAGAAGAAADGAEAEGAGAGAEGAGAAGAL